LVSLVRQNLITGMWERFS